MEAYSAFDEKDLPAFTPETKIGILATVNADGLPHLTLITSLQPISPTRMIWGQFAEGQSKAHVRRNPRTGFLILTLDLGLWRGKARWIEARSEGPELELLNRKPMFRYNAYFGLHTVHYMDLVGTGGREILPFMRLVRSFAATRLGRPAAAGGGRILSPWAEALLGGFKTLKFLSFLGADGYPAIVPVLQCVADSRTLSFAPIAYGRELKALQAGMPVAALGLSLEAESVLVRGVFRGYERRRLVETGQVDIDWVYNSMPPVAGQLYPPQRLEPVVSF